MISCIQLNADKNAKQIKDDHFNHSLHFMNCFVEILSSSKEYLLITKEVIILNFHLENSKRTVLRSASCMSYGGLKPVFCILSELKTVCAQNFFTRMALIG